MHSSSQLNLYFIFIYYFICTAFFKIFKIFLKNVLTYFANYLANSIDLLALFLVVFSLVPRVVCVMPIGSKILKQPRAANWKSIKLPSATDGIGIASRADNEPAIAANYAGCLHAPRQCLLPSPISVPSCTLHCHLPLLLLLQCGNYWTLLLSCLSSLAANKLQLPLLLLPLPSTL